MTIIRDHESTNPPNDPEHLYKSPPPAFGHDMLPLFDFDEGYVNLNHGSYGSLPRPVKAVCEKLTTEIERNPDKFHWFAQNERTTRVRERLASMLGAHVGECVMITNTSHGLATVLRNFAWGEGDVIVGATTTYGSVSQTLKYLKDTHPQITLSTFNIQLPTTHAQIVESFEEHIKNLSSGLWRLQSRNPRIIAVIDAITSTPGARMPWKEMVRVCAKYRALSVVDAAHALGQEPDINLGEAKPDFWVSNCHKWLFAKRGCAVLYVPRQNHHLLKSPIPTPFTYRSPQDNEYNGPSSFVDMFESTSTIDYVPYLSVDEALNFRAWLGGEALIHQYCHTMALRGGRALAQHLGTEVMDPDGSLTWNMVNVALPIPGAIWYTQEVRAFISRTLLLEWNVSAGCYKHNGRWWTRCSAQIWTEVSDFLRVGNALKDMCKRIVDAHERGDVGFCSGDPEVEVLDV
ncbi:PLP-dependent transferase [Coniophora puteana RWD-64-598 SS2]|uniref:PLP-dependent transferase n=1 Tax=Coniophora puteana (strain RWD-64-598) TaxID=741705 RepID=A0A5M3N5E0_CONPW|nr:PLP-dependent transferase [Coniophora puteana RWD-64-598 SS2]EIW86131.1 PLP-dependent transferase [Coniophora puteana RWD-64-598 SS2]